jgi:4-phytase/acid phosphatase
MARMVRGGVQVHFDEAHDAEAHVLAMGGGPCPRWPRWPRQPAPERASPPPPRRWWWTVVLVMRHGVRPPTKDPAMPADVSPRWPAWPVQPGWLTARRAGRLRLGTWTGAASAPTA